MSLVDLITADRLSVPMRSKNKAEAIRELVALVAGTSGIGNAAEITEAVEARESLCSTGLDRGIAIPHAKTEKVQSLKVAVGIAPKGIDFDALDGKPSRLFFMILTPPDQSEEHVKALSEIAAITQSSSFVQSLIRASSPEEAVDLFHHMK